MIRVTVIGLLVLAQAALAQQPARSNVELLPDQLTWTPYVAGGEQAFLVGNPSQPGTYAIRLRLPAGLRIPPHTHPDFRIVTVLSGTIYFGHGEAFDSTRMQAFPTGAVWTETPVMPHYAWAKDGPVVLQIVGTGPSRMDAIPQRQGH